MVSAVKAGISEHPHRLDEIPFESEIQYMATLNQVRDGRTIFLKGVPEKVVRLCDKALAANGQEAAIDPEAILAEANSMASNALRVIAIAEKRVGPATSAIDIGDMAGFTFLGLQGMMDPPRPEAVEAVRRCQDASIRVVMITGDHGVTARAIAAKLGITEPGGEIVTGEALERMTDEELFGLVERVSVYARASPIHKYRIVQQLRRRGEVIAVTGDGVNDAPALRAADIGVSMGMSGTDVAKEASDMILADDNFATIVNAVEEGRHMYNNLQKMLAFILPTNFGQCLVIVVAIFTGALIPLLPLHVLWINLVTSVTCSLPLAVEGKEDGLLRRPPRDPDAPLFTRQMLARLFVVSAIMTIGAFIAFYYSLSMGASEGEARTITVTAIVMMELAYLFSSRSFTRPAIGRGFLSNRWIFAGFGLTALFQLAVVYLPAMNALFKTEPMHALAWVVVLGTALALFVIIELEKVVVRHLNARKRPERLAGDGRS
jgi:Ca2+-transporting ATPase